MEQEGNGGKERVPTLMALAAGVSLAISTSPRAECLPVRQLCDGYYDCTDRTDESNCGHVMRTEVGCTGQAFLLHLPILYCTATVHGGTCHLSFISVEEQTDTSIVRRLAKCRGQRGRCSQFVVHIDVKYVRLTASRQQKKETSRLVH